MKPGMLKRLERFNKALDILKEIKRKNKSLLYNDIWVSSVAERNIQIAAEFAIDLCNTFIASIGGNVPETYKESVDHLLELGIVDKNLASRVKEIIGLRNILVHMYADIKYDLIYDSIDEIVESLKKFVSTLLKEMEKRGIDP